MNPTSAQDLVNMGFYGYQGWDDAGALADYRATGGAGKGSATNIQSGVNNSVSNFTGGLPSLNVGGLDIVKAAQQLQQPGIQAANQAISDTKARYEQLKNEITGQANTDVAAEFGKRGIPTSSGIVQQAQGRESARRSTDLLASESSALAPFYQMLIGASGLDPSLISAYLSGQNQGGGLGLDDLWNSNFTTNLTTNPNQQPSNADLFKQRVQSGQVPSTSNASLFQQRVQSGNVPQATVSNSLSPLQNVLNSGLNLIGNFATNPTKYSLSGLLFGR